jgi:hypothetical protein
MRRAQRRTLEKLVNRLIDVINSPSEEEYLRAVEPALVQAAEYGFVGTRPTLDITPTPEPVVAAPAVAN